jgi:hypothetical protein
VHQPEHVYEKVLADNPRGEAKVGYVDFLSDEGDNEAAYRIWRRVVAEAASFPFSDAAPYVDRLIALGRIAEAVSVWQDLAHLGIVATPKSAQALKSGLAPPESEGAIERRSQPGLQRRFRTSALESGV